MNRYVTLCVIFSILCALPGTVRQDSTASQESRIYEERLQDDNNYWQEYQDSEANWDEYQEDSEDCRQDNLPIILWWTPFTGAIGLSRYCSKGRCCLTQDRSQIYRQNTKAVLFYGTDFDPTDLPIPRGKDVWWGLLHEESPKNKPILSHASAIQAFNLTGTFKRESDFPLSLQYLPSLSSLTSRKEFVSTRKKNELLENYWDSSAENRTGSSENNIQQNGKLIKRIAPIVYVHSDCDTPSERDKYMTELSKYIKIDSLGDCNNNRVLPSHLKDSSEFNHPEFRRLLAKYKFTLTIENYGCNDYITEKLWRPLTLGSVPLYWGSPTIADWEPNPKSVIKISDFSSPEDLADYLYTLLKDDSLYESHLTHKTIREITNTKLISEMNKRKWGIDNSEKGSFVDHYECFVCDEIYSNHPHLTVRPKYDKKIANVTHCGCPEPKTVLINNLSQRSFWLEEYEKSKAEAEVLGMFLESGKSYTEDEFYTKVFENLRSTDFFSRFPPRHDEL